jgi:hypothetical protein
MILSAESRVSFVYNNRHTENEGLYFACINLFINSVFIQDCFQLLKEELRTEHFFEIKELSGCSALQRI